MRAFIGANADVAGDDMHDGGSVDGVQDRIGRDWI